MNRVHHWICRSALWRKTLESKVIPWVIGQADMGDDVIEIGPGPGLTTDYLRSRYRRITSVEIDSALALALHQRMRGGNVRVISADAARLPFADATFTGAVSFTMLHHVPSPDLQDRLLAEVRRVLKPGAIFAGSDSRDSWGLRMLHLHDTLVPVDPGTFGTRLERAGFADIKVSTAARAFRFRARRAA